ncbi:class I SAM-dependent methyltransferase [Pseudomonas sp. TE50-2]|uniref:class I SAM-dependent methyltransferase n=1 Tax=Pseudomonas sp. TE50-2 TaxID=3142707 RepID=UPI003466614A
MKQNIYDNETFFQGYKALRQNDTGLNGALEIPAMQAQLPQLSDLHVLDIGCGFGDFARLARSRGAATVTGVDVSARMIKEARALTDDPWISYHQAAIEDFVPVEDSFNLVVSSMALHYVADYVQVIDRIYRALKPGGRLVFSVEHPICTAAPIGWITDESGNLGHWPIDRYGDESIRSTRWFVDGVFKYHRTVATYVNTLLQAGFQLLHLGEPAPEPELAASRPELQGHLRRPPILLLAADKPG